MDAEMRTVFAQLEEAGIWYVPLKGSVLKEYYPEYGIIIKSSKNNIPYFTNIRALLPFLPVWRLICVIKKRGLSLVLREIRAIKKA